MAGAQTDRTSAAERAARANGKPATERAEPVTFTGPAVGALYASVVIAVVIAVLDTDIGRDLQEDLDAPARALVAAPVLLLATVVFILSVLALVLPASRRGLMRFVEIFGWLIPAWLLMAGTTLAAIAYALDRIQ
jgi:protein-S-isoprenylcysteine O-methyltransferase Ste14